MKVRQQLQEKGLVPDEWGGETIFVDVSALTKQGVDKLLEMILLQADLLELKANPNRRAKGNVIESGLEPGGPTATVLVRKGTLRVGDVVICGPFWGKVRALISEEGNRQKEAGPSVAVKILGLNGVPEAGLEFSVLEDEKTARDLADQRAELARTLSTEARTKVTLENLFATLDATQAKTLKVVVKADTQGSVEAIVEALKKIEAAEVSLEVIHSAVGTITESDVLLASASSAIILGFHTRIDVGRGRPGQAGRSADQALLDHLRVDRPGQGSHGRLARTGHQRGRHRLGGSPQNLRVVQRRQRGRLHGHQRAHRAGQGPHPAPQGPDLRRGHPDLAPLPGRSQRSARRHGVRHPHRRL